MAERVVAVNLVARTQAYVAQMRAAAASNVQFGASAAAPAAKAGTLSSKMGNVASSAGLISPALLGAGGAIFAIKSVVGAAIEWETAFTGVAKTVDATEGQLAALSTGLRDMSTEIPTTAVELASIAEAAGQLGIETDNVLDFTETMAGLGEATNLSSEQAATAFARFANITQMSQDDFDRLGSAVVDLGNNLATTEAEISEFGLRLAGAGAQIGLSEAEILGLGGALSSVGINAEAGGTAVSKVMIDMAQAVSEGGEQLGLFAQTAGMSAAAFSQAFRDDPASAIAAFIEGLGRIDESGGDLFATLETLGIKEQRMRDAMLRTAGAGTLVADSMGLANDAYRENVALSEEVARRHDTNAGKWDILKNKATELRVEFGERLTPVVGRFLDHLNDEFDEDGILSLGDRVNSWAREFGDGINETTRGLFGVEEQAIATADAADWLAASAALGADKVAGMASSARDAVDPLADVGEGGLFLGESFDDAADAMDRFNDAIDRTLGRFFGLQESQDAVTRAYIELTEQVEAAKEAGDEHATSLEGNSEAALDNRAKLTDLIETTADHVRVMGEQGAMSDEVAGYLVGQRSRLMETLEALGLNRDEARVYIDALEAIPTDVSTDINADTSGATGAVRTLRDLIDGIPRTVVTRWRMEGTHVAGLTSRGGLTRPASQAQEVRS